MTELTCVPTSDTLAFIQPYLPRQDCCRLLEVGCGVGELAFELLKLGHEITAIDSDADAVQAASARGVDAQQAVWPDFDDPPYDGILFTRSLHHLHPLDTALARAVELLRPGGMLLIEDFAFSDVEARGMAWFTRVLRLLSACAMLDDSVDCHAARVLQSKGDPGVWRTSHDHDLNSAADMEIAIRERLDLRVTDLSPYFYRYLVPYLRTDERAGAALHCFKRGPSVH